MSSGKESSSAQCSSYFDIDDILATQERLPCRFELQLCNLGFMDPGSDCNDLATGTKLELPIWVAQAMCSRGRHIISTEVAKQYRESWRLILEADPIMVDLHKMGPHYFTFAMHLLAFDFPECPDIARALLLAFQTRLRFIMDSSQNTLNQDTSKLTSKLDEVERLIFEHGQNGLHEFQHWETRRLEKLISSSMVTNLRKRKAVGVNL